MKRSDFIVVALCFLVMLFFGCRVKTLQEVENKWGPPARVEETDSSITWFYYFHAKHGSAVVIPPAGKGTVVGDYITVEIIATKEGKITNIKKYWHQPKGQPVPEYPK